MSTIPSATYYAIMNSTSAGLSGLGQSTSNTIANYYTAGAYIQQQPQKFQHATIDEPKKEPPKVYERPREVRLLLLVEEGM